MTFDITIPVLNEEETLLQQVKTLHHFLLRHFPSQNQWQIVIADNGSTDHTAEIAESLASSYSEIKYVKVPERGVGLALKTSWSQSKANIVGYMDLDLATDLKYFLEAYQVLVAKDYDFVYGTRLHPKSQVIGRSFVREITSRAFNKILKIYLGNRFSDGMCGFKFLKRKYYPALHQGGAENNGWFFSTELLTVAEWQKLRIYELPIKWTDDTSNSRVRILPLAKKYLASMVVLKSKKMA